MLAAAGSSLGNNRAVDGAEQALRSGSNCQLRSKAAIWRYVRSDRFFHQCAQR